MSTLLLPHAARALRRSLKHRPSLPRPVRPAVEKPRLFSSGIPGRKQPNKDANFHTLKHMKLVKEEEKGLRETLAMLHEEKKNLLAKYSRIQIAT